MARVVVRLLVAISVMGLGVALVPVPASAASVTVKASATADVFLDPTTCVETLVVITAASFSPGARFDEVIVSWTGPVSLFGKTDSHSFSSATTSDRFVFTFPLGGRFIAAGTSLTADVKWSAHNGSGLSAGGATVTTRAVSVGSSVFGKITGAAKCGLESQSRDAFDAAANERATAAKIRPTSPTAARWHDGQAALYEAAGRSMHRLALDPPDPHFTTIPAALAPTVPTVTATEGLSAATASALNDLNRRVADLAAQSQACLQAVERALGAHEAGDAAWEQRQSLAAAGFLDAVASQVQALPAATATAATRLQADSSPAPAVGPADRAAVVDGYLQSGPPNADILRQQLGLGDDDLQQIAAQLGLATSGDTTSRPITDAYSDSGRGARFATVAAQLHNDATALRADPMRNTLGSGSTPTTAPTPVPSVTAGPTATTARSADGASLLANNGFEQPPLGGAAFRTIAAGTATGLPGWTVEKGSVDVVAGGGQAAAGQQFLDLNGNSNQNQAGVMSQTLTPVAGHHYRLTFQLSGNPNGDPTTKTVQVDLGDQRETFSFDITGHTNADLGWATHQVDYSACGDASTLRVAFTSLTTGIRGPNLDNITLVDLGAGACGGGFPWWLIIVGILLALAIVAVVILVRRRQRSVPAPAPSDPEAGSRGVAG